ncbi:4Fe-4S binding protein [Tepidibacillus marianensis]|uniref:4Fe-4S binding protein n=1 Tax=Tepidibacillus marianensis TaxID=3131995 RepID=UPI0030CF980B
MLGNLLKLGMEWAQRQKPILVHAEKCTHTRHRASSCKACTEICPMDSIELKNGLSIDWSCNSCGLCTSVCPTEALELREKPNKEFYTDVKKCSEGNDKLFFHCQQAKEIEHLQNQLVISCFGMIDEVTIQLAITNGIHQFHFLTDVCEQCTLFQGKNLFQDRLKQWKQRYPEMDWITMTRATYRASINNEQNGKKELHVSNQIARREFFKVFGNEAKQSVVKSVLKEKEKTPWENGELITQQSIRLQVYQKWIKPNLETIYPLQEKQFQLNEDLCTLCGICEKVCPTQAIQIHQENQHLDFRQDQCISCDLCEDVCYRKAITLL